MKVIKIKWPLNINKTMSFYLINQNLIILIIFIIN